MIKDMVTNLLSCPYVPEIFSTAQAIGILRVYYPYKVLTPKEAAQQLARDPRIIKLPLDKSRVTLWAIRL